jgi:membrane-associated phospholipid phosphatase
MLQPHRTRYSAWITILCWVAAIAAAAMLDSTVAAVVQEHGCARFLLSHGTLRYTLRAPGYAWFTIPVVLVLLLHAMKWRASVFLAVGAALSSSNVLIKWIVGRTRPYKLHEGVLEPFVLQPFRGGLRGAFDTKNLSFPSGDASLAFATAAALSILLPKWRWTFYAGAAIVAVERVLEDAHWLSDTVGAAALGIGAVWIVRRIWWDRLQQPEKKQTMSQEQQQSLNVTHG